MFHVNPTTGDVGKCTAQKDRCPFGGAETHFTSPEAARAAYESQQAGTFTRPNTPESKFPYMLQDPPGAGDKHVSTNGKRADGSYPKLFFRIRPEGTKVLGPRRELLAYLEDQGVTVESAGVKRPDELLGVNPDYVSERAPLVAPNQPKGVSRARVAKPKEWPAPTSRASFEDAIMAVVPEPDKSKVAALPAKSDPQGGYMGGRIFVGALAQQQDAEGKSIWISQTTASAGIKKLVAEAKKAGELPKWVDISVRKNDGAWVSSISVEIGYKPEGSRSAKSIPREWREDETGETWRMRNREAAKRLEAYVSLLARQYESSDVNSMVDYHNSHNAGRVTWRDSWRD